MSKCHFIQQSESWPRWTQKRPAGKHISLGSESVHGKGKALSQAAKTTTRRRSPLTRADEPGRQPAGHCSYLQADSKLQRSPLF